MDRRDVNDALALLAALALATTYVAAAVLLVRKPQRRSALAFGALYLAAGWAALWLLSSATGAHYAYGDLMFEDETGALVLIDLDLDFLVKHLGLAVCLGFLGTRGMASPAPVTRIAAVLLGVPILAEPLLRAGHWANLLFGDVGTLWSEPSLAVASIGPAAAAGLAVATGVLLMSRRGPSRPQG